MKSEEKLNLLTKSIRMINQAKILKTEAQGLTRRITVLQRARLHLDVRANLLVQEAHKIQYEVIPVTVVTTKRKKKILRKHRGAVNGNTLEEIFGKEEAKRLSDLAEKTGLLKR